MADTQVRGARLVWQQLGEGSDLILVHGLAASRAFWFPAALQLQASYRVTLFDMRGHGYSEMTESGYSSRELGRDILELMDALEIEEAALVGHSFGGGAALEATLVAPDRIRSLGLLDTRVQSLQPQMRLDQAGELSTLEKSLVDNAGGTEALRGETQIGIRFIEAVARMAVAGNIPPGLDEYVPFGQGAGARRTAKRWLQLLDETAASDELTQPGASTAEIRGLKVPLLLANGERSPCWPSAIALSRLCPQARLQRIDDAGHFFPLGHPSQTVRLIESFLEAEAGCAA